jgi:hypothetical protein
MCMFTCMYMRSSYEENGFERKHMQYLVYVCQDLYACMHVCMCVCMYIYVSHNYICTCACMERRYMHVYAGMFVCMYLCT